jgi:hypothetical protein
LAFLYLPSPTATWAIAKTTDGINWTSESAGFAAMSLVNSIGHSVVFRDSIFWWLQGNDSVTTQIRAYDFKLESASQHGSNQFWPSSSAPFLHVHKNNLYALGKQQSTSDVQLWRFDGVAFGIMHTLTTNNAHTNGSHCLFSDGDDLIGIFPPSTVPMRAFRISNVLPGESASSVEITSPVLNGFADVQPHGAYPFVSASPDPSTAAQRIFFWYRQGDYNSGTFNLFRFNYRKIDTGTHTGSYILGETVTGGTSGATGVVTDIDVNTSLSLTDVVGVFQLSETLTGDGGATSLSCSTLDEEQVTSLGVGVSAANFGLPVATSGLNRIPTKSRARPEWNGLSTELTGGVRRRPITVFGEGADIDVALYHSANEETPDQRSTLIGVSIADVPVTTGLIGNLGEVALEALSPSVGDAYVVSVIDGDGSLVPGGLSINEGDIVEYDGANWIFAEATSEVTAGVPSFSTHATLSTSTPLISPYVDGVDDGKFVAFDGTSQTGIILSVPSLVSNEARDLTPSNGATTYNLDHDSVADGFSTGDRLTLTLDVI